uniref:Asparagine--tRNA ligase, cytoplasmic n=1 Tax=Lygus hesperus TaxID=30085 RepID=A0A0A9ZDW0_LYGHE
MTYNDAIQWLCDNSIMNEETGTVFTFGDDITESPERRMVDTINKPIFLHHFPAKNKPFYMAREVNDPSVTQSVDLLLPTVGEIVGGSMRTTNLQWMLERMKEEKVDPSSYYWYTDLRKYGSSSSAGWGIGVERLLCWFLGLHNIRDACLFPRYIGRASP